jgi:hypothetical protein
VPVGHVPGWIGAGALVLIGGTAFAAGGRHRRWLAVGALGALCIAAGYALFVPAEAYYQPLLPGTIRRMNVLAAVGFAVLVYALVRLALRRTALVLAACAAIAAGYVVKVAGDEGEWQRSARIQAQVLSAIRATVPHPAAHTTFYSFGAATYAAPGVPAFSLPFDLKAATRLAYGTALVAAYPVAGWTVIQCAPDLVYPTGGTYGRIHGAVYGSAVFVDVPRRRAITIRTPAECLAWRARLGAGPG